MVLHVHLYDLKNVEKQEKHQLRELFDKHGLPHVVTEEHIVITPDSNHLAAKVVHFSPLCAAAVRQGEPPQVCTPSARGRTGRRGT